MNETKTLERVYVIPLRRTWLRTQNYRRASKTIKAIKKFIAKHMKIPDRDISKVKFDVLFNNEIWFRGRKHPPSKIKVKARKEEGIVYVTFVEEPSYVKFLKAKQNRFYKKQEEKKESKQEEKKEELTEKKDKNEEKKIEEKEKEVSVKEQKLKEAESKAKAQKHLTKVKETKIQRMALKK